MAGSEGRGLKCKEDDLITVPSMFDAGTLGAVDAVHIQAIVDCSS